MTPFDPPAAPLPDAVDPVQFARRRQQVAGTTPLADLARLVASDVAPDGSIAWQVSGETGRDELDRHRSFIDVRVRFAPTMTCVRCLEPVQVATIDNTRRFRLAASERQAELEDRDADQVDVIAETPRLDLATLVEDEAILALPMAPAHEHCAPPATLHSDDAPDDGQEDGPVGGPFTGSVH
jgi:uncharacterized protein